MAAFVLLGSLVYAGLCFEGVVGFEDESLSSTRASRVNDFIALYAGAQFALRGHLERAYDFDEVRSLEKQLSKDEHFEGLPALYPPFFYLLLMPFARFDMMWAYRLWILSSIGVATLVALRIEPRWQTLLLVLIFPALAFCAAAGQNGILSAAVIGAGLLLLPGRPVAAGIVFGLMAYKPQLAVAIPFCLVAGKHYRALAAMVAAGFATILVGVLSFGLAATAAFLPNALAHGHNYLGGPPISAWRRMPTPLASMLQLTDSRLLAWTTFALIAVGALAALAHVWRATQQPALRAVSLAAAMPLVTPYFLDYDLAILLVPTLFLVRDMRCSGSAGGHLLVLGALWLTQPALRLMPSEAYWPFAPVVWILLLAYAVSASTKAEPASNWR